MVSLRLGHTAGVALAPALAGTLIAAAACGRRDGSAAAAGDTTAAGRAASLVQSRYRANDIAAAGAWTWAAPDGSIFVLIDAQSLIEQLVQARAELWTATDSSAELVGRSDVMPSAAEFGAYAFDDLTGDGLPDLFGYVADSAGVSYPVFIPGARGGMVDQIPEAAPGWQFSTDDPSTPQVLAGPAGACALQLWAAAPAPDGQGEGWRYLSLMRGGNLSAPRFQPPDCPGQPAVPGVQPGPAVP